MLVDSHCHLDFPDLAADRDAVIARAVAAGVTRLVTISTHVRRFETYRAIAEAHDEVVFTVGTHPHHAAAEADIGAAEIVALASHPRCVGIGEAGLDHHYDHAPRDVAETVFRTHITAARETGLPLVIHARDADDDIIRVLEDEMGQGAFQAILHCFSSGPALARAGLALGFTISFSGILTFKRSDALRTIAAEVPLNRLLVETDAPYLAPQSRRGQRNEPAYVAETARVLAEVKGVSPEEIAAVTTANALRLFSKAAASWGSPTAPMMARA